jgi:hypothetical protein
MPVTKQYPYTVKFDRGTAEVTDKHPTGALWQVVFRAKLIPDHRIEIETHDDPVDPCDNISWLNPSMSNSLRCRHTRRIAVRKPLANLRDAQRFVYFHEWQACFPTWVIGSLVTGKCLCWNLRR